MILKLSLLKPKTNKSRNKRTQLTKPPEEENTKSDFEKVESSFGRSIDLKSDDIFNPKKFCQHMAFDHFWNGLRFDPKVSINEMRPITPGFITVELVRLPFNSKH